MEASRIPGTAFPGKLQYGVNKGRPQTVTKSSAGGMATKVKGEPSFEVKGAAITAPARPGKAAGKVAKARFLGGDDPALDDKEPFRPAFVKWAMFADNPFFTKNAVSWMWAHFFGRGVGLVRNAGRARPSREAALAGDAEIATVATLGRSRVG